VSDESDFRAVQRGEEEAFVRLYDRYRPRLYSFIVRMCGRPSVAEELVQETFIRLADHAATLREDTHVRGWLFHVARNLVRSHARSALVDALGLAELASWVRATEAPSEHEAHVAERIASRSVLDRALLRLGEDERAALWLAEVEGYSSAELAEEFGISEIAVRQRVSRARKRLSELVVELYTPWEEAPVCET